MFEIIFLIILSFYFIISVIVLNGASKTFKKDTNSLKSVSVIVCARDEEKNISACMESLNNLDYHEGKLEIILVDDGSTDSTGRIIDNYIKDKKRFKKIFIDDVAGNLKGKTKALAEAIKLAQGEIILTTDADCTVQPGWAKTTASYYNKNIAVVCGFTKCSSGNPPLRENNLFEGMQAVDLIYLLTIASGTANTGMPISCIGNNMSFLKEAYLEVGGFENLHQSVTEDFALLNAVSNLKKYKILFPLDKDSVVSTQACPDFKNLFSQKKRWAAGGLDAPALGTFVMACAMLANLFILLTPLFFTPVYLYLAVFKISIDFFVLYPVHKTLDLTKNLKYFFIFQIYYSLYVLIIPLVLLFSRKVVWKGREY